MIEANSVYFFKLVYILIFTTMVEEILVAVANGLDLFDSRYSVFVCYYPFPIAEF